MDLEGNGEHQRPHHQLRPGAGTRRQRIDDGHAQTVLDHGADRHGAVGFQVQLALHAGLLEHGIDLLAIGIVARQADKAFPGKVSHLQHRPCGQRMACGQHGHLVHGGQRKGTRARRRLGQLAQAQVVALGGHPLLQQRRLLRGHADGHGAMLCVQARQRCGQQRMAEGRQAQHVDARLVRPRQGQRMLDHAVQTLPAALHFGPQREGACRGPQPALGALEQRIAQQAFQARQFAADGGLGAEQHLRRRRGAAAEHERAKHLQVAVGDAGFGRRVRQLGVLHGKSISKSNRHHKNKHWTE